MQSRSNIRKSIRAKRLALTERQRTEASQRLKSQLIQNNEITAAKEIAAYFAHNSEIDPMLWLQENNQLKNCYLPIINPQLKQMQFARFMPNTPLIVNQYGIPEPAAENQILVNPQYLDIVLVPLVAFDLKGNRLGTGAGYYDRTFAYLNEPSAIKKPKLLGLAYEFQKIDNIVPEVWDVALDGVITDQNIYLF